MADDEKIDEKIDERDPIRMHEEVPQTGTPRWVAVALGLLAILTVTALWLSSKSLRYSENGLGRLDRETQTARTDTNHLSSVLSTHLGDADRQNASLRTEVKTLLGELESVEADARGARKQVAQVRAQAREQIRHLIAMDTQVREQLASKASVDDLKTITSDVNGVRNEIETTSSRLKSGHGELGVLIARNHDEIEILRQRGDRDYFEFTIKGKNASEQMGDVTVTLRGTDPKKNECNLELFVDDKSTQRRSRAINEPIFFYRERERVPSEIVVNDVKKNEITGYLSMPKEKQQITLAGAN